MSHYTPEAPNPLLAATRIVLVAPSLPENVGAVARSMHHFGLTQLVLVGGVSPRHPQAIAVSAGCQAILEAARVLDTLEEALAGASIAFGTTARPQDGVERRVLEPREAAALAASHAPHGPVVLVMGTEKHGLSIPQLRLCDQLVTIPGEPEACLNLAHAVTVLAYEWRLAAAPSELVPLNAAGGEGLAEAIVGALTAARIIRAHSRDSKLHALKRILSRAMLTPDEAALLRGLARGYSAKQETLNEA